MCRNCMRFCGSATLFVLFPLIFFNAATAASLSDVKGAPASLSERDIQEAQKIVGQYLQNKSATDWLAKVAKTNSTPLTTSELLNAILRKTEKGDKVWQAASTLLNASNSTNSISSRMDVTSGQTDNWKDLIANIEMEDDIICLYRKNSNETTKRADDWKKFLETVTPGHEVHLAIDTGRKYVICLKKKPVPETTTQATSTTTKKASTTVKVSSAVPTGTTNAISTLEPSTSMPSSGSRAFKKSAPEPFFQKLDGVKDHLCRGRQDDVPLGDRSNLRNAAINIREIRREMQNYLSSSSPTRVDCFCKTPGLYNRDNVPEEFPFSLPIFFVVLNPNDYSAYKSPTTMNSPFYQEPGLRQRSPYQNRRCMTKPLDFVEFDAPDPSNPSSSASQRLRDPISDYNSAPSQSVGGLLLPKILDEKARNDAIARRTLLRSKRPSPASGARSRTSCLTDSARPLIQRKETLGRSMPDTGYVDYLRFVAERNRYENSRINHRAETRQVFPALQKIYKSPITTRPYRQPIVERSRSWDYNKLPYSRKLYSPIQNNPQTIPRRPALMQYFNRKDPNLLSSRPPPCRNSQCMRTYRKPLINYNVRPRPFPIEKFQFGNPANQLPLLHSLLLGANLGLNSFTDIPNKLKCPNPCDRPIKLQVVINGKVREPLDVAVLTEPGQKVDLVGFSYPMLPPHQAGTSINRSPFPTRLPADTHTYSGTEINTRMDLEKLNANDEASLTESAFSANNNFEPAGTNSTTQITIETTTFAPDLVSVAGTNVEQRVTQQTTLRPTTVIIGMDEPKTTTTTTPIPTSSTV